MFETVSNYCVTEPEIKEFIYTWKIINFKYIHPGVGECIESKNNSSEDHEDRECIESKEDSSEIPINLISKITIYPDGYDVDFQEHVGINVHFNEFPYDINYCVFDYLIGYLIDKNGTELEVFSTTFDFADDNPLVIKLFQTKSFIFDESNGVLPNNSLTIKIKVYVTTEYPTAVNVIPPAIHKPKFDGFEDMINNEKFSDVKISVDGDKIFHVHKCILAARSPVFAIMFDQDMKENTNSVVHISDVDYRIMQEVLRFIYAGKVNAIEDIASDLLVVAVKYELGELKLLCEQALIDNLKEENVTNILNLAEKYSASTLKKSALDFFKIHAKEIVQSEKYKADFNGLSPLLLDIIKSLAL